MVERRAVRVRVTRFGGPEVLQFEEFAPGHPSRRKIRGRVPATHASVGSTDAMARAGDYLLQPRPGFVPGYDFLSACWKRPTPRPSEGDCCRAHA